ncbi:MAG TPA: hypothetical protein VJ086_02910 [Rubrobacteraceae bacterium]|jgi:predicted enzyme related to lactoylglutathione lyase|nr:hypothetical protein [Rubrobacteraceae bacterium]
MRRYPGYLRGAARPRGEFSEEPNERPWGIWAQFKDPDDNEFGLIKS